MRSILVWDIGSDWNPETEQTTSGSLDTDGLSDTGGLLDNGSKGPFKAQTIEAETDWLEHNNTDPNK